MHCLVVKCVMLQLRAITQKIFGRYFGRYNAVWSIFGRYLINFCRGRYPIQYNPTGRSANINLTSMAQVREGRGRPVKSKEIIDSSVDSGDEPTPGIITETVGSYTDEAGNKVGTMLFSTEFEVVN